ncbi:hypothetical protein DICPUDRAFT_26130 [Dictyostelium purpureum]|uniref:MIP18 family-like domain-containing protein n=1 Tax=Dictyostelium purpureum TaxID=5786 RepID=F0Z896_DICPU|nr:uncharacterized protein DICPUDRAFT_26130 [Dictyostelium purpureum]EGC39855.1 hypothetical protein DICPUDRAFT_26130 [Dictyostelium purpureum]|eukprot:XP_003283606.1 hypothetical protein DICPUDRAFT_26130 [Dictyostelium purpureum]
MINYNNNIIDSIDVFDIIRHIKDPEYPNTLEQLKVVNEDWITVEDNINDKKDCCYIKIYFTPTVPHCHLAPTIALCIREKINQYLPKRSKIEIYITPGSHQTEEEINKQINDKERIIAALENPEIYDLVQKCIKEDEY